MPVYGGRAASACEGVHGCFLLHACALGPEGPSESLLTLM